jgi:hypothetical protein
MEVFRRVASIEAASHTISNEAIPITAAIKSDEEKDVMSEDITNTFVQKIGNKNKNKGESKNFIKIRSRDVWELRVRRKQSKSISYGSYEGFICML